MSVTEVSEFLETLYGENQGFVYCPSKSADSGYWQPYFFNWPSQKKALLTHILSQSKANDTYVAPSLFRTHSAKEKAWRGSQFIWVEFDGNAPKKAPEGIPQPAIRIQSSTDGHEHWYWRLEKFQTDITVHKEITRALTYTLDADKSGWDAGQVLRPPGTLHHDSGRRTRLLKADSSTVTYADFKQLVVPPKEEALVVQYSEAPAPDAVIAKYKWSEDAWDLFTKDSIEVGVRSSAMTRLAFDCVEMGMTNEECYTILRHADERWGKFKSRSEAERTKRLVGIITHCRSKKEVQAELSLSTRETFVTLGDFLATEYKVKWLYRDFLAVQGLGIISSAPGVGKSTFSLRLGLATVLGQDFLKWKCEAARGTKVGFLSLEMGGDELNQFVVNMLADLSEEDRKAVAENFFVLPLGYAMMLYDRDNQRVILDEIDRLGIDVLIIDSLKAATGLKEQKTDEFFNWVNQKVRSERKCTVWMIHHNRKQPMEGSRTPTLEDLYGDTFIGAHPSTVIVLRKRGKTKIEVLPVKVRMAKEPDGFVVQRTETQGFEVTQDKLLNEEEPKNANDGKPKPPAEGAKRTLFG